MTRGRSRQIAEGHGGSLVLTNREGARGCYARLRLLARHGINNLLIAGQHSLRGIQVQQHAARVERWWTLEPLDERHSEEEWLERVRSEVGDAVRRRLVADVPLGALLSGCPNATTPLMPPTDDGGNGFNCDADPVQCGGCVSDGSSPSLWPYFL
mgnify:CR=1 FL=1